MFTGEPLDLVVEKRNERVPARQFVEVLPIKLLTRKDPQATALLIVELPSRAQEQRFVFRGTWRFHHQFTLALSDPAMLDRLRI